MLVGDLHRVQNISRAKTINSDKYLPLVRYYKELLRETTQSKINIKVFLVHAMLNDKSVVLIVYQIQFYLFSRAYHQGELKSALMLRKLNLGH